MAVEVSNIVCYIFVAMIFQFNGSTAKISTKDVNNHYPKAIYDLKETIVRGLGFQSGDLKITGFDLKDALVGTSIAYEFHLEIGNEVFPLKLLDDVDRWKHVDLPILQVYDHSRNTSREDGSVSKRKKKKKGGSPTLEPFQLSGPMELWIQDHNVGQYRKVILEDGAVVTVKGAKSVSLLKPIELDLPLTKTQNGFASSFLTLADRLKHTSQTRRQLVSLCIVGSESLTSNKLKLKWSVNGSTTLWPVVSVNGSNTHLTALGKLLFSILGPKANEDGSFRLLRADVSAHTFLKIGFQVEKSTENGPEWPGYPKWRTKPDMIRAHFEVLARFDGEKIVPERVVQFDPVRVHDTMAFNVITRNVSSTVGYTLSPPKPLTL